MSTFEFNSLLTNNSQFLKPYASRFTHDKEAAKDLFQETMYLALSNQERFNEGTNIKAWLYTIMRNIFINNYRLKVKQNTVFDHTTEDYLLDYNQSAVANCAEANLGVKEIHRSIKRLPKIFKRPFMMYFEGYKYHEIAEQFHVPVGTIKSRIHFARKILKAQISRF